MDRASWSFLIPIKNKDKHNSEAESFAVKGFNLTILFSSYPFGIRILSGPRKLILGRDTR